MRRYDVKDSSGDKYVFGRTANAKHKFNGVVNRRRGGFRL